MSRLLTDIEGEVDKHRLSDGDYDITGLLQAQRDLTAREILNQLQGIYNQASDLGVLENEFREFIEALKAECLGEGDDKN